MPFLDEEITVPANLSIPQERVERAEPEGPSVGETFGSAFRMDNTLTSIVTHTGPENEEFDKNHNPAETLGRDSVHFRDYSDRFAGSRNEADTLRIRDKIDQELADRRVVEESGALGVAATLAAGLLDPINLLPGGAIVKGVRGGVSVMKTARNAAVAGGVAGAAAEGVLQSTQETRTGEETAYAIGGSAILSGVLGGAAASLLKRSQLDTIAGIDRDMTIPAEGAPDVYSPGGLGSSAGAAQVLSDNTPKSLGKAIGRLDDENASLFVRGIRDISPVTRLESGPSSKARRLVESLAESVTVLQKAARGEAQARLGSVETRTKLYLAPLADALEDLDASFLKYRFGDKAPKVLGKAKAEIESQLGRTERLAFTDFKKEVAIAMRNGDEHAIAEVAEAARNIRTKVYEPLKDKAIELGLLPEDVDVSTAISYLNRVYDKDRIRAQRGDFKAKIAEWLRSERDAAQERAENPVDLIDARVQVNTLRDDIRSRLAERDGPLKEARAKKKKKSGQLQAEKRGLRSGETEARRAAKREEDLKPSEFEDAGERAFFSQLHRDLKNGVKVRTVQTDIISKGGIKDAGGDLRAIIGKGTKSRLINNKSGKDPEEMIEQLLEEGYFYDQFPEDVDTKFLLNAIEEDIRGDNPVVNLDNVAEMSRRDLAEGIGVELDRAGLDVTKMSPVELKAALNGDEFKPSNPKIKGRLAENKTRIFRALRNVEAGDEVVLKIEDELADLDGVIRTARENGTKITKEITDLRKQLARAVTARKRATKADKVDQARGAREDAELDSIAEEIIDRIISTPDGRLPYDMSVEPNVSRGGGKSGLNSALKGRVFNIPDNMIQDFLENDVELLSRTYTRSMAADVELVERFGDVELTTQIKEVVEEFNEKIAQAGTDEKLAKKLQKQKDNAVRDIAGIRDRLRGTYGIPEDPDSILLRAGRVVRSLNYLRLLGGMTVSAIPDLARTVMVHGISRTFGQGLVPLMKNFSAYKAAGREVKMAGTALDMVLDTRAMAIADIMDDYGRHSKFERALHGATSSFGVVTLMAPWNAALKQFSGMVTMSRILENAKTLSKGGTLTTNEIEALARAGIDENLAKRIWSEFEKHGDLVDGSVYLPKTEGWTDADARTALRGAVVREVDKIVVTPGQEKPLFMSREGWKLITQFKSFAMSSTQRTLLAGLQQRDAAALNGAMISIALGGLSYTAKQILAGREVTTDPREFLTESFDRSGLAGWFMEPHNLTAKLTRGTISLSGKPLSRYASRNITGALLGPTAGLISDIGTITGDSFTGEFSQKTARAVRRLAPYQNVFWMREILNQAESGATAALGIPEK